MHCVYVRMNTLLTVAAEHTRFAAVLGRLQWTVWFHAGRGMDPRRHRLFLRGQLRKTCPWQHAVSGLRQLNCTQPAHASCAPRPFTLRLTTHTTICSIHNLLLISIILYLPYSYYLMYKYTDWYVGSSSGTRFFHTHVLVTSD